MSLSSKIELVIYSEYYSIGKLGLALKLFLKIGCLISKLKPSPNDGRKQGLSPLTEIRKAGQPLP
jgi:hypothetical protein